MTAHEAALLWLGICAFGLLFAVATLLDSIQIRQMQKASGINGLRSMIVRGHVRTSVLRTMELAFLAALALPEVLPLPRFGWVGALLLFLVVGGLVTSSLGEWRDRRKVRDMAEHN